MHASRFSLSDAIADRLENATELFREDLRFFRADLIPIEHIVKRVENFDDFCQGIALMDIEIYKLVRDLRQEVAARVSLD